MRIRLAAWKYSLLSVEQMFKKTNLYQILHKIRVLLFLSTFHLRPDIQPLFSFHPSNVVNSTNLDSSEDDDDDDKMQLVRKVIGVPAEDSWC